MLVSRPQVDTLGFSLNPIHYVKKGVKAVGKGAKAVGKTAIKAQGLVFKAEAAVGKLPGASAFLNTVAPGSGALLPLSNKAFDTIGDKMLGKKSSSPAQVNVSPGAPIAPVPAPPPAAAAPPPAPAAPDNSMSPSSDTLFGLPKKYVILGGMGIGAVVLLSVLAPSRKG